MSANGCGSSTGVFRFVRPPQGHARRHCDEHDLAYDVGGDSRDRAEADWRLLLGLLGDATGMRWWQRPGFRCKAVVFWVAVRVFGAGAFNHHKANAGDSGP